MFYNFIPQRRAIIVDILPIRQRLQELVGDWDREEFLLDMALDESLDFIEDDDLLEVALEAYVEKTRTELWDPTFDCDDHEIEQIIKAKLLVARFLHQTFLEAQLYDSRKRLGKFMFNQLRGLHRNEAVFLSGPDY